LALGLAEGDQKTEFSRHGGLGDVDEFERLAVIGHGLVRGELGHGAVPGTGGVVDGPGGVGCRCGSPGPVVSQGGKVIVESAVVE
jgi:hypothetical protein